MGASLLWNRPRGSRPPFRNNGRIDAPDLARSRLVLPGRHRSFLRAFSARGRIERCRNNGRIVGSAEEAMGDATPGHACTAAAAPATGRAAPAGGPAGGRRRAAGAGVGEFGVAVVADVSARRAAGPAAHADPGPTAAVVRGTAAPAGEDPGAGSAPGWLPHGSLDPGAGAKVVQREFGIRYHPSHVWKMLTARGWRCQPFELSEGCCGISRPEWV